MESSEYLKQYLEFQLQHVIKLPGSNYVDTMWETEMDNM